MVNRIPGLRPPGIGTDQPDNTQSVTGDEGRPLLQTGGRQVTRAGATAEEGDHDALVEVGTEEAYSVAKGETVITGEYSQNIIEGSESFPNLDVGGTTSVNVTAECDEEIHLAVYWLSNGGETLLSSIDTTQEPWAKSAPSGIFPNDNFQLSLTTLSDNVEILMFPNDEFVIGGDPDETFNLSASVNIH